MSILAAFGPTDGVLVEAMIRRAYQGPSEAQVEAAPAQLVAYLATPRTLEELYPWGERRFFRPRMVRSLVRQLLGEGQIVTDGDPASPADWAWLWAATAAPPAPGARPDQERLDKLTPKIPALDWYQHHVEPEAQVEAAPAVDHLAPLRDANSEGVSLEEVAKEFGLTRGRIRQIEAKALNKIRERAPELFNHLTGGTVKPGRRRLRAAPPPPPAPEPEAIAEPALEPLPEPIPDPETPGDPVSKDLPKDEYGSLRQRVLNHLADHPEGARGVNIAKALGAPAGSVRTTLDRAVRFGHATKDKDSVFRPTAATREAADAPACRRPPVPAEGILRRAEATREQVLAALTATPRRAVEIRAKVDAPQASFFRAMGRLVEEGLARRTKHGLYALASTEQSAPAPLRLAPPPVEKPAPIAHLPESRRNVSVTPAPAAPPAGDRLAAARAAVAALSPEELDALLASLAPVVEARRALAAALAGLRVAA